MGYPFLNVLIYIKDLIAHVQNSGPDPAEMIFSRERIYPCFENKSAEGLGRDPGAF